MGHWSDSLRRIGACSDAVEWAAKQPSLETAWASCTRGDWMLWLIRRTTTSAPWSDARKPLVACEADCAALALPYVKDEAVRAQISDVLGVIRGWTRGEATREETEIARNDAWRIYCAAADAAAYAAARNRVLSEAADIVRRHFPVAPAIEHKEVA